MNAGDLAKRAAGYFAVGLHGFLRNWMQERLGILLYHRVTEVKPGVPPPEFTVTPGQFYEQLHGLQKRGFTFLTLRRAIELADTCKPWPHRSLVVTFDDGFENVYLQAWPILRRLGIPATIFVNTAFLDSNDPFPFDHWGQQYGNDVAPETYRPLRDHQCREMMEDGLVAFGAHTHTHQDFRGRPDALREDLQECVRELKQRFGVERPTFAFPYGRVALGYAGGALTDATRETEVTSALTTECRMNPRRSDPFHWGRFNVYDWDTSLTLAAKFAGCYGWAPRLQEWMKSRMAALRNFATARVSHNTARIAPSEESPLEEAFQVSGPPWYERLEDVALHGVSALGIGLNTVFGRRSGVRPGIVNYHRVAWAVPGLPDPMHNVTPAVFREQLEGLLSRGFTAWPLDRLLEHARQQQPAPSKTFVVTFDDGFESVYTQAWPVLKELNIPASLFVNTAYLDLPDPFPFDEWGVRYHGASPAEVYRPLTGDQIREMLASGLIHLGAHTHTHEDFRGRPDDMAEDLAQSAEYLREHFGLNEVTFAFPFGSRKLGFAGPELVAAAKTAGVTCGLTTDPMLVDFASDPFEWGRFNAFAWDTSASLAAKLNGWYSWAPRLKRWLADRWKRPSGLRTAARVFSSYLP